MLQQSTGRTWRWSLWCVSATSILLTFITGWPARGFHDEVAECRNSGPPEEMIEACWTLCATCHGPQRPLEIPDIAATGDVEICGSCHEKEAAPGTSGSGLLKTHGGNHPNAVSYDEAIRRTALRLEPSGPKLYLAPHNNERQVLCSTCHDPMGAARHILRVQNDRSALCLACHNI